MQINTIENIDCLEAMKKLPSNSIDLMFCDPPYALGSDVIILPNGKPEYRKAVDFMNRWHQPNGDFWEEWFKEANRVLKYGGHCLMFGLDRQLLLYKYFACFAGFTEKQSLYWYFISNFPKSSDLSKNLDKNAGAEREVVGIDKTKQRPNADISRAKDASHNKGLLGNGGEITAPSTDLAKKYNGMKYSIAPLKQTNETIMVFQKKYKTGSCMHDVLAMENGDDTITCGALDIENNRIEVKDKDNFEYNSKGNSRSKLNEGDDILGNCYGTFKMNKEIKIPTGRFPSQTFVNDEAAKHLDLQSGVRHTGARKLDNNLDTDSDGYNKSKRAFGKIKAFAQETQASSGGCSKILHKCNYELERFDIYTYCPKVSSSERNYLKKFHLLEIVSYLCDTQKPNTICEKNIIHEAKKVFLQEDMVQLLKKDIEEFGVPNKKDTEWSIEWFTSNILAKFLQECKSTTKTETNWITELKTLNWLHHLNTNENIQVVKNEMEFGGSLVLNVTIPNPKQIITETMQLAGYNQFAKSVVYQFQLKISEKEKTAQSDHPTVKPIQLLRKILSYFKTPNKQILLDCFAGSGSMELAAYEEGYDYIAYELDSEYYEIAKKRIFESQRQTKLF